MKYFIKPTKTLFDSNDNLFDITTNFYNSRSENASLFIKNFTLAIIVKAEKSEQDFRLVEDAENCLNNIIESLKKIINKIKEYQSKNTSADEFDEILISSSTIVTDLEDASKNIKDENLAEIGYVNILAKLNTLIGCVRNASINIRKSTDLVKGKYKDFIDQINNIVNDINHIITESKKITEAFVEVLYDFTKNGQEELMKALTNVDSFQLLSPENAKEYYFAMNMYYDENIEDLQGGGSECDLNKYFIHTDSEANIRFDKERHILLEKKTQIRYRTSNQEGPKISPVEFKLWLIPISSFILLKAFSKINAFDATDLLDQAITDYKGIIDGKLYLKRIYLNTEERVSISDDTIKSAQNTKLLWPKDIEGQYEKNLSLKTLVYDHFTDSRSKVFGGPRYEKEVKAFFEMNERLLIRKNSQEKYRQEERSIEDLMNIINSYTGSANSRLARKIGIFSSEYLNDKFQFSLYDKVSIGSLYTKFKDEKEVLEKVIGGDAEIQKQKGKIEGALKNNKDKIKEIAERLSSLKQGIESLNDFLNKKPIDDYSKDRKESIVVENTISNDNYNEAKYEIEFETESGFKLKVEKSKLNNKVVNCTMAKSVDEFIFRQNEINLVENTKPIELSKLRNILISPVAEALQYDINDYRTNIVRSKINGYFMAMMYLSLPYHRCFQKRNWWDGYHTPKSKIVFMSKAAKWYYRAYIDICDNIWKVIGVSIGSIVPNYQVQQNLKQNINSNIKSTQIKSSYNNAYGTKDLSSEAMNNVSSAVNYVLSTSIFTKDIIKEEDIGTEKIISDKVVETVNSMHNTPFLSSGAISSVFLTVFGLTLVLQKSYTSELAVLKEIVYPLNDTFIGSKTSDNIRANSVQLQNMAPDVTAEVAILEKGLDDSFTTFATRILSQVSNTNNSDQLMKQKNLLLIVEVLYLKIWSARYKSQNNKSKNTWTELIAQGKYAFGAEKGCESIYNNAIELDAFAKLISHKASNNLGIVIIEIPKIQDIKEKISTYVYSDEYSQKLGVHYWDGCYPNSLPSNNLNQDVPYFIECFINNIYKFSINDDDCILTKIQNDASIILPDEQSLKSDFDSFVNNLKCLVNKTVKNATDCNTKYEKLGYASILFTIILLVRVYNKKKGGVRKVSDVKQLLDYCIPMFIFGSSICSRIFKDTYKQTTIADLSPLLEYEQFVKSTGLNIGNVFKDFLKTFMVFNDSYLYGKTENSSILKMTMLENNSSSDESYLFVKGNNSIGNHKGSFTSNDNSRVINKHASKI